MPSNREVFFKTKKQEIETSIIYYALQEVNDYDYFELIQHFDDEIKNLALFNDAVDRYKKGEMIEYIFSKAYFLSLPLYVNKNVLIPRQETEQLVLSTVERITQLFADNHLHIADVCTGSGAIGLALANKLGTNTYYLTDISKEALNVAKRNSKNFDIDAIILQGDLLKPLIKKNVKLDVLVCNPPYIENTDTIDKKTWENEPHLALLASPCTKFYEEVLIDLPKIIKQKHLVAFEIGEDMEESLTELVKKYCPNDNYEFEKDIYDKTRFLFIYNK